MARCKWQGQMKIRRKKECEKKREERRKIDFNLMEKIKVARYRWQGQMKIRRKKEYEKKRKERRKIL